MRKIQKREGLEKGTRAEMRRSGLFLNWEQLRKSGGTLVAFPHPEALFYCVMACHGLWLSRVMISEQLILIGQLQRSKVAACGSA
jgi:hypothetical protein